MGYFKNINFNNYRNFNNSSFSFSSDCNIIFGKNGSGKTNILEGISLFEKGRGFRKEKIRNLINFFNSNEFFNINSTFEHDNDFYNINVSNNEKNLKKISINKNFDIESIQHFESLFSIIYFLPEMERLFISNPSSRRNFFDRLIFTYNKKYNFIVNSYKKAINERQLLLKNKNYDENWMLKIENNIVKFSSKIYQSRIEHLKNINTILRDLPIAKKFNHNFSLSIDDDFLNNFQNVYHIQDQYLDELKKKRIIDSYSGGSTIGPHRSDILGFNINNNINLNQYSTGQQKTAILLIILSQCKYLLDYLKLNPIILLDEICSHLDNINREIVLYLIEELKVQVFMTGTEKSFFSFLSTKANYCNIA